MAFADPGEPYSCSVWGNAPDDGGSQIVVDTDYDIHTLFNLENYFPSTVWIDHTMKVHAKLNNAGSWSIKSRIDTMLENCEPCNNADMDGDGYESSNDNCPNDYNPGQEDLDGDLIGDACDDCYNAPGDLDSDFSYTVLDVVALVQVVLGGGLGSDECELSNSDLNNDGTQNIQDIIVLINLIFSSSESVLNNDFELDKNKSISTVGFYKESGSLYIKIVAQKDIAGVQINIPSDRDRTVSLIPETDNTNIKQLGAYQDGMYRFIAYSDLGDVFDSRTTYLKIDEAMDIDFEDLYLIISDKEGNAMELHSDMMFRTGVHEFALHDMYPNPFNPSTEISFTLPVDGHARLSVFNLAGREVSVLHDGYQSSGMHHYTWNAADLPSGVYYIRLAAGNKFQSRKAMLMK